MTENDKPANTDLWYAYGFKVGKHTHIHKQEVSVFLRKTTEKELLVYLEC